MNRTAGRFFSIVVVVTLVGCSSYLPIQAANTPTFFATARNTSTAQTTATSEATAIRPTITATPGANISFLYLSQGRVQQYDLQNWSTEKLSIQSDGEILQVALSPDQRWLAFQDRSGIKLVEQPFIGKPLNIPTVQSDQIGLLFSNNSQFLAYADGEGLKILNILEGNSSLLITQSTDQNDVSEFRFYSPEQWSPDNEWLWLNVSHWEGVSHVLAHVSTKTFHEYSGCYSDTDWFKTSKALVATVRYSGYLSCGDNDGVYIIALENNNQTSEKRIYQETSPAEASAREARELKLSPDSEKITFVQLSYPEQTNELSRLMLIDLLNREQKELDSSKDVITSPFWSTDSKKLFYTVQSEKESQVIRLNLDSDEKAVLSSLPNKAVLFSDFIDDEWLVAGTIVNNNWDSLYIVNTYDGTIVKVSTLDYDSHVKPFLGVVQAQ